MYMYTWNLQITDKLVHQLLSTIWRLSFIGRFSQKSKFLFVKLFLITIKRNYISTCSYTIAIVIFNGFSGERREKDESQASFTIQVESLFLFYCFTVQLK